MTSIAGALGIGSGLDTGALVSNLTAAVRDPKNAALSKRESINTARISAIGQAASAIDSFASSLTSLIGGGTLFTQPTSSDTGIVAASALPGSKLAGLAATLEVRALAQAQTIASSPLAAATSAVGEGTLRLSVGGTATDITIDSTNNSLSGLAAAINAKKAGVTASVVSDTNGARLVLKGASGVANAFTLAKVTGDDAGIGRFAYGAGAGMTLKQPAQDAILVLDGVEVTRGTNSISDLIDGVKLDLTKAAPGTTVNLGFKRPTSDIKQAMTDFVSAYNQLETFMDNATAAAKTDGTSAGVLAGDSSMRTMRRMLSALATTALGSSATGPKTLAEIGVKTNRDGSLAFDSAAFDKVAAADPEGVEALFNPGQRASSDAFTITSAVGRAKPGTYALANIVPASGSTPAHGTIGGYPAIADGDTLTADPASPAAGLVIRVTGPLASGSVVVDQGVGGALTAIRDALRGTGGALTAATSRFEAESKTLGQQRTSMEARIAAYKAQLETNFTAMEGRLTLLKATQSQLTSQIAQWNNSGS